MKKIILSLLIILPLSGFSQQKPEGWLTSYADATFKNGKIVYSMVQPRVNMRLLPRMYPRSLVSLSLGNQPFTVNAQAIAKSEENIRNYLNTELVNLRSAKEQNEYLRLSAMVLLWDMNLSPHCLQEIKKLKASKQQNLAKEADILLQVNEIYQKNK